MKKSKEACLTKLDLTLAPEHFGLEVREHSLTLQHLIPTLNVTEAKPCENVMKLTNKKKRENVEQGTFTPVMFSATGGTGRECSIIFKKLSQLISIKRKEKLSVVTYGIRCKISFALLRSCVCMYKREPKVK